MYEPNIDPKLEPLEDQAPHWFLSNHADKKHAARQIIVQNERAAIWDTETGKIVWQPDGVNALCWAEKGTIVLAAREGYEHNPALHGGNGIPFILSPLQAEYTHIVEVWTWPELSFCFEAPFSLPTGWVYHLVASHTENKACIVWRDQTEAGIEWVAWDAERIWQDPDKGYFGKELNGLHAPVFSPNGKYIALVYAATYWWGTEDEDEPEGPSSGGTFCCGKVVVCDSETGMARETEIMIDVPPGFLPNPDDEESDGFDFVLPALFLTEKQFSVGLRNGEARTFSVD